MWLPSGAGAEARAAGEVSALVRLRLPGALLWDSDQRGGLGGLGRRPAQLRMDATSGTFPSSFPESQDRRWALPAPQPLNAAHASVGTPHARTFWKSFHLPAGARPGDPLPPSCPGLPVPPGGLCLPTAALALLPGPLTATCPVVLPTRGRVGSACWAVGLSSVWWPPLSPLVLAVTRTSARGKPPVAHSLSV